MQTLLVKTPDDGKGTLEGFGRDKSTGEEKWKPHAQK
jgi:hypothetical protein